MTTEEAFKKMIATKGMAKKLGLSDSTFGSIKYAFKTGKKTVSLDKKIELLQKAGYVIEQDIVWRNSANEEVGLTKNNVINAIIEFGKS